MIELHPEILSENGRKIFVILPYTEYEALQEYLEDVEDLIDLRKAKEEAKDQPTISLEEVKKRFGM